MWKKPGKRCIAYDTPETKNDDAFHACRRPGPLKSRTLPHPLQAGYFTKPVLSKVNTVSPFWLTPFWLA